MVLVGYALTLSGQFDLRLVLVGLVQYNLLADHLYDLGMGTLRHHLRNSSGVVKTVLQNTDLDQFIIIKGFTNSCGEFRSQAGLTYLKNGIQIAGQTH